MVQAPETYAYTRMSIHLHIGPHFVAHPWLMCVCLCACRGVCVYMHKFRHAYAQTHTHTGCGHSSGPDNLWLHRRRQCRHRTRCVCEREGGDHGTNSLPLAEGKARVCTRLRMGKPVHAHACKRLGYRPTIEVCTHEMRRTLLTHA